MFKESRVVITGAAGALGRSVVEFFENEGAHVAALDLNQGLLDAAFPRKKPNGLYLDCDLTKRASCAAACTHVIAEYGHIDILCNIAGGFLMGDEVHETSDKTWDFLFDLNTRSILNMSAAVVPGMKDRGAGKVVNVAAKAALSGAARMGVYTATKAAVMRLTESMALELRDEGINVNCIMPGVIDTPRNRIDMPDADHTRWVAPTDIARVIGFLCGPQSIAIHGAAIPVDGLS